MLHVGPCAKAVGSGLAAPGDTEGAARGREMSTSSVHHTLVSISWSRGWDFFPGQVTTVATCLWGPRPLAAALTGARVGAVAALPGAGVLPDVGAELMGPAGATGAAEQQPPGPGGPMGPMSHGHQGSQGCGVPALVASIPLPPQQMGLSCQHAPCAVLSSAPWGTSVPA